MSILKGFIWVFLGKGASQIITFILSIVLARILLPEEFGLVGMIMVIISIAQIFGELGLSSGVVQSKKITTIQLSTIFYINIVAGMVLCGLFMLLANPIANFYNRSELVPLIQILSTLFIISSIGIVPNSLLRRNVKFKSISIVSIISLCVSGSVAIITALLDFGVFALVFQYLSNTLVYSILIWYFEKWRPNWTFSLKSIAPIWIFSSNLFYANLLDTFFNRADIILIGKLFSPTTLGYYSRSVALSNQITRFIADSLGQVFFPTVSKIQDNRAEVASLVIKALHSLSFVTFYIVGFLHLVSDEFFILIFTEKWLASSDFFKIILISAPAYPFSVILMNVLNGVGNSRLFLRLEIIKKVMLTLTYVIGFQFGIQGFLIGLIITRALATYLNAYYVGKEIELPLTRFTKIILDYLIPCVFGQALVNLLNANALLFETDFTLYNFLLKGLIYSVFYGLYNYLFRLQGLLLVTKAAKKIKSSL